MVLAAPEQLAVPHAQLHPSTSARALPFPFNHFLGYARVHKHPN